MPFGWYIFQEPYCTADRGPSKPSESLAVGNEINNSQESLHPPSSDQDTQWLFYHCDLLLSSSLRNDPLQSSSPVSPYKDHCGFWTSVFLSCSECYDSSESSGKFWALPALPRTNAWVSVRQRNLLVSLCQLPATFTDTMEMVAHISPISKQESQGGWEKNNSQ